MRDLRREHKRDRIAKREIINPDVVVIDSNASTSTTDPVLPETSSSINICDDAGNKMECENNGHGCNSEDEYENGQVNLLEKNRSSEEWAIVNRLLWIAMRGY